MDADQHTDENAETRQEQSSGWWTASPSKFPAGESTTSTNFFDNPPVLFMTIMWAFPYTYMYLCLLEVWGIASLFKLCGSRVSDYISKESLAVFAAAVPLLFLVMLLVKGRWFRNNLISLLLVWFLLVLTSGLTQGAVTSALIKAYCAEN